MHAYAQTLHARRRRELLATGWLWLPPRFPAFAAGALDEPVLDVVRDQTEDTTMTLTLDPLPTSADLFQGHSLIYVIDVQPTVDREIADHDSTDHE